MKANELRIGNIVGKNLQDFPQNYFKVLEVAEQSMKTEGCGIKFDSTGEIDYDDADYFEGVLLTKEWLMRFGAEVEECKSYSLGHEMPYKVYTLGKLTYNSIQAQWWYDRRVLHKQPEYVHQLQNLYFALTGTELTIKTHE